MYSSTGAINISIMITKRSLCLAIFYITLLIILYRMKQISYTPNSIDYESIRERYKERTTLIRNYCYERESYFPEQIYINSRYHFLKLYFYLKSKDLYLHYCSIGKVGGGTWKNNLEQIIKDEDESMIESRSVRPSIRSE